MADHVLIVLSNPTEGNEDAYNDWYTHPHLAEVLALPGFVAARRFALNDNQVAGFPASSYRYLAIYEIDGDPASALRALEQALGSGDMVLPPAVSADEIRGWCFSPISDRVTGESADELAEPAPTS